MQRVRTTAPTSRSRTTVRTGTDHEVGSDVDVVIATASGIRVRLPKNPKPGQSVRVVAANGHAVVLACDVIHGANLGGAVLVADGRAVDFTFTVDECDSHRLWTTSRARNDGDVLLSGHLSAREGKLVVSGGFGISGLAAGEIVSGVRTWQVKSTPLPALDLEHAVVLFGEAVWGANYTHEIAHARLRVPTKLDLVPRTAFAIATFEFFLVDSAGIATDPQDGAVVGFSVNRCGNEILFTA